MDFIFLGSIINTVGNCSHEIERCLLFGRKAMTNLDKILKSRYYFADQVPSSQSYGFSSSHLWMWQFDHKEGWAPRIDVLELWCWRKFLRVLWTAKTSNQSVLKEISPEYSLEELILKLELLYFSYLIWRLIGKDPDAGKDWRRRRTGQQRTR